MLKRISKIALPLALILVLYGFAPGSSVAEYRTRVNDAMETLGDLEALGRESTEIRDQFATYQQRLIEEIKEVLPIHEKVEHNAQSIEVDNRWLHSGLDEMEKEAPDSADRTRIINGLAQRLEALSAKLDEITKAEESSRTKDEDKTKLNEILTREEYKKPEEKEESLLERAWRQFQEWWRKNFPQPEVSPQMPSEGLGSLSKLIQGLVILAAVGLIAFLIYRFAPMFSTRFKRRKKKEKEVRVILGETLGADETASDLFAEAEKLAGQGNLRAAIRKGYIALLCELNDRKIIGLARHKTNRDYLRDLKKRKEIYGGVSNMTGSFERHWYGFASAETEDWDEFRQNYRQTLNQPAPARNE